jgi:SAM-dependent methyltransferase
MSCLPAPTGIPAGIPPAIIDKRSTFTRLASSGPLHLELGCGDRKRRPDAIGIDISDFPCVDIVGDVIDVLSLFPDGTVESITSSHLLEHMADVGGLLDEMARVLKTEGRNEIIVPHFSNAYYYSDLTHKHPFGLYTLSYFAEDKVLSRKVPHYGRIPKFRLLEVDLRFKAARPFYARYLLKRLIGLVVNCSRYTKEFYEENLTAILPCYEIRYVLQKLPTRDSGVGGNK